MRRRIGFITAIPKSASSLLSNFVGVAYAGCEDEKAVLRVYPPWWKMAIGHDWDLRPEIYQKLNQHQSAYKGHFWPTGKNIAVLDMCSAAIYIVLLRSPKDQIAAEYCSALYQGKDNRYNPIYRIDNTKVCADDVDGSIHYMITGGYLAHSLMWMTDWLRLRHKDRSFVLLYEDLMTQPLIVLRKLCDWADIDLPDDEIADIWRSLSQSEATKRKKPTSYYPRGWTGKVGVWRDYFSAANDKAFQRIYNSTVVGIDGWDLDRLYLGGTKT